jgi:hypothetical protein
VLLMVAILPAIMAADYSDWVAKGYRWSLVSAGQVGVPAEEFSRHSGKIREVQDRASQAKGWSRIITFDRAMWIYAAIEAGKSPKK